MTGQERSTHCRPEFARTKKGPGSIFSIDGVNSMSQIGTRSYACMSKCTPSTLRLDLCDKFISAFYQCAAWIPVSDKNHHGKCRHVFSVCEYNNHECNPMGLNGLRGSVLSSWYQWSCGIVRSPDHKQWSSLMQGRGRRPEDWNRSSLVASDV